MPTVLRALLLSALLTLVPVAIGVAVSGEAEPEEREPAAYEGTALEDFDTSAAVVQRAPFCDLVPAEALDAALGGEAEVTSYDNGESSAALPAGDVAHEYGCLFTPTGGGSEAEARAWVFAPPVTAAWAGDLVASTPTKRCAAQPGAPAYGTPSVAVLCTRGDNATVSYRGLFGDAWLACSLTLPVGIPEAELVARAGTWCVAVAEAAAVPVS